MSETRIYIVEAGTTEKEDSVRLVKATSQAAAVRHVTRQIYSCRPATASDVAALAAEGKVTVEQA